MSVWSEPWTCVKIWRSLAGGHEAVQSSAVAVSLREIVESKTQDAIIAEQIVGFGDDAARRRTLTGRWGLGQGTGRSHCSRAENRNGSA
jgi:hypothetical protein